MAISNSNNSLFSIQRMPENEKITISDYNFTKKDDEINVKKKNKKLQVEIANYNKNNEKLCKKLETL